MSEAGWRACRLPKRQGAALGLSHSGGRSMSCDKVCLCVRVYARVCFRRISSFVMSAMHIKGSGLGARLCSFWDAASLRKTAVVQCRS